MAQQQAAVTTTADVTPYPNDDSNMTTLVTLIPQCLSLANAEEMRKVAENRATRGSRTASGDQGYALYSNPLTSNSGTSLAEIFRHWKPHQRMRMDMPYTTHTHGGRFMRKMKKAGQFRDSFAYGTDIDGGVKALLENPLFFEAARKIHPDRPIVEPGFVCLCKLTHKTGTSS